MPVSYLLQGKSNWIVLRIKGDPVLSMVLGTDDNGLIHMYSFIMSVGPP